MRRIKQIVNRWKPPTREKQERRADQFDYKANELLKEGRREEALALIEKARLLRTELSKGKRK